jgi:uncharacterized membrane protein YgcG
MRTHNDWGVGSVISNVSCKGGTGILVLVSVEDKTCFISTGKALSHILTDGRLDTIISNVMKPSLREGHYNTAIVMAIRQMKIYMNLGPPTLHERLQYMCMEYYPFVLFMLIAAMFIRMAEYKQQQSRSDYATVRSRLDEIEKSRALALHGKYDCTSCPICLEQFQSKKNNNSDIDESEVDTKNSGAYESLLQPYLIGSNGLPVKLLRCGHTFDETCWNEWVANGKGNPMLCPICRLDIGVNEPDSSQELGADILSSEHDNDVFIANHYSELRFRLDRLRRRYPRYISQSNVILWTRDGYDGPIARDADFLRNNPDVATTTHSSSQHVMSTSTSSSFGGGTSCGGRGGRW